MHTSLKQSFYAKIQAFGSDCPQFALAFGNPACIGHRRSNQELRLRRFRRAVADNAIGKINESLEGIHTGKSARACTSFQRVRQLIFVPQAIYLLL